ncbi:SLBB domain-containing protein [Geothermobacter hydrogeniphilus]|uniref:Protein involved in polysaccharide export, contains SLBB domain of the beta-grasp fold n=1 Tax=Geothermobacter hydrogeniphilus TaxID=1969733 RepID=A0A1X0Y0Z5_9BACT|nr:SLBB domain-containing protein [Geothermobacter hydrogeniphilus]ORJ58779.1 hypothetical protein B5V00_11835 [Geothermobacter hydrogeniphilus]
MRRYCGLLIAGLLLLISFSPDGTNAQAAALTANADIGQLLQQVSPQEREKLLQSIPANSSGVVADKPLEQPQVVKPLPSSAGKVSAGSAKLPSRIEARMNLSLGSEGLGMSSQPRSLKGSLRQFGYDLFAGVPTTFAPVTEIPIPTDYVLGPGDQVQVQLYGNLNENYTFTVDRDGAINLPKLGPLQVAGQKFAAVRKLLSSRVETELVGVKANVSLGELRSMRIFVLGNVRRPGSYVVSSLTTMTNALFVSGGIKPIGSLRDIQLKRRGKLINRLDLYDLLQKGDTSGDVRMLPGDVLFVPHIGPTVGVAGEVRRPAIYELKGAATVADALQLAEGLLPTAQKNAGQIVHINSSGLRTLQDVSFEAQKDLDAKLKDGDLIRVYPITDHLENLVVLKGHVRHPGSYQWHEGMRITDLLPGFDAFLPDPDLDYVLVRRETRPNRRIEVFSIDLAGALADPSNADNVLLQPRDQVLVFGMSTDRQAAIAPLIDILRQQARSGTPEKVVSILGHVSFPGSYPLETGMSVGDLVRAAGGLRQEAYRMEAELTRTTVQDGGRKVATIVVPLAGADGGNFSLQPFDQVQVRPIPDWSEKETVTIKGEVRFPGVYTIKPDESLRSFIERAGGLTERAFIPGTVFSRADLRTKEAEELKKMRSRLKSDLASMTLEQARDDAKSAEAITQAQQLLAELQAAQPVGRMVINLRDVLDGKQQVLLRDGDVLVIPRVPQEVTVLGEVQSGTSHLWRPDLSRDDYIDLSGGLTAKADDNRIYVVRANGAVIASEPTLWFGSREQTVQPGDTVVVPVDLQKMQPLSFWQTVADITYKLALTAAAGKAVGVF